MLNAIIALVLIGMVFATAFFIYASFIDSYTQSQVTQGFENFITPIQAVCQGESQGLGSDIVLPVTEDYTYGVFQTKLAEYTPDTPLLMRKCEDSYCLCLFREPKSDYEFWSNQPDAISNLMIDWGLASEESMVFDDEYNPAPLWHFNTAGVKIFPSLIARITGFYTIKLIEKVAELVVPPIVAGKFCEAASAGAATIACNAAVYAAVTLVSRATLGFVTTYLEELTEPYLLENYPMNFMSTNDPDYLTWSNLDVNCDGADYCEYGDYFSSAIRTLGLTGSDWGAIGFAVAKGALEGAIDGLFSGLDQGISAGAGTEIIEDLAGDVADSFIKKVIKKAITKGTRELGETLVNIARFAGRAEFERASGISALNFDFADSYRPTAYVRTLLGIRRSMVLGDFVGMYIDINDILHPFTPQPPAYEFTFDEGVRNFESLDIINCVSISDLGPQCDSDTKILMDYDIDFLTAYRVTDPINFPGKSVFCGYNPNKESFEVNILGQAKDFIIGQIEAELGSGLGADIASALTEGLFWFLDLVVGEWLLAGADSMSGLLMECVQPQFVYTHQSEYFQYWIPYQDLTGYYGTAGNIPLMTATLSTSDEASCRQNWLSQWNTCRCNFDAFNGDSCNTYTYDQLVEYDRGLYNDGDYDSIPVCPYSDTTVGCAIGSLPSPYNATCTDLYQPLYLECINGVHVNFGGVFQ
jgi:hypothetical protein